MLPGTDGAVQPFWSPDSRFIAFGVTAERKLKKIDPSGGLPQPLGDLAATATNFGRGTWNRDGTIIFGNLGVGIQGLRRVSASAGGEATDITKLDTSLEEIRHAWPWFLPDGRHFLYLAWSRKPEHRAIYVGSLKSTTRTRLMAADSMAIYAAPGFVLFAREGILMRRPFDADRLEFTGEAVPVAEEIFHNPDTGRGGFDVSDKGTLITYRSPGTTKQLVWMDRAGKTSGPVGALSRADRLRLSPDGKRVAFSESSGIAGIAEVENLWIYDIDRGVSSPLTTDPSINHGPVWSPDGSRLVFDSSRGKYADGHALYEKPANGATPERVLLEPEPGMGMWALDWSRDERLIVFARGTAGVGSNFDLWVLPLSGDRKAFPYLTTPFRESQASVSPNGHWLAYTSNESGSYQVIVQSFPDPNRDKKQISTQGGVHPRWSGDGREIYYLDPAGWIVAVAVTADQNLEIRESTSLFDTLLLFPTLPEGPAYPYDVTPDGRFLMLAPPDSTPARIIVVLNWVAGLKRQ